MRPPAGLLRRPPAATAPAATRAGERLDRVGGAVNVDHQPDPLPSMPQSRETTPQPNGGKRMLRFGAFMNVPSSHPTGWRHPDAVPETDLDFRQLAGMARTAERGKLDALFFQDSVAIPGSVATYGGQPFRVRSGRQAHIEPVSAIAALAAITSHVGLISTCTTSYNEPYNVARRFLTIDHISGGRAGWNLVTSQAEDEAVNFGRDAHFEHGVR